MNIDDEWAGAKPVNLQAEWDSASKARTPPTKLKIGAEGFEDAMRQTMRESGTGSQMLAGFGSFPRQLYEGGRQFAGEIADYFSPKRNLSSLVTGQAQKRQWADPLAIKATRVMEQEAPASALAGSLATLVPLSAIPGANTVLGQAAVGAGTGALMPTLGGESRAVNAALGGAAGAGTAVALKGIGAVAKPLLQRGEKEAAALASRQAARDATIKEAFKEGYVLPPSVTGGGKAAAALESVGGKAAVGQEASIRNQQITNKIARREAGLGADEALSEGSLAKARERLSAPYREVADISPRAKSALEKLQEARQDSKDAWKKYGGPSGGPEERRAALAADNKVEVLERLIEKEAQGAGKPDLLQRLREARVAIAKNHNVESALVQGSGDVDAHVIGRILDKKGEKAITGGLQTIGKFAQAFPTFAREKPVGQSSPGIGQLKPYLAGALGVGGYEASQHYGFGPWGGAAAGLALLGGPARSIALSKLMQHVPEYRASAARRIAYAATKSPFLPAAATGVTLQQLSQQ